MCICAKKKVICQGVSQVAKKMQRENIINNCVHLMYRYNILKRDNLFFFFFVLKKIFF